MPHHARDCISFALEKFSEVSAVFAKAMALAPTLKIEWSLPASTYRRSAPNSEKPRLLVKTTLLSPPTVTLELIGEWDTQTILDDGFRLQHFSFIDVTTDKEVINIDPYPGTCDPHIALGRYQALEVHASMPHETEQLLDDVDPLSDPVRQLEVGHEYVIKLSPQRIRCYEMGIEQVFGDRKYVPNEELPEAFEVVLACDQGLKLKVED